MPWIGNDFMDTEPGETATYTIDFNESMPNAGESIVTSVWDVQIKPGSIGTDPDPGSRLVGPATIQGTKSLQLIGSMLAGVTYRLTAVTTTSAGQVLRPYSHVKCTSPS